MSVFFVHIFFVKDRINIDQFFINFKGVQNRCQAKYSLSIPYLAGLITPREC